MTIFLFGLLLLRVPGEFLVMGIRAYLAAENIVLPCKTIGQDQNDSDVSSRNFCFT